MTNFLAKVAKIFNNFTGTFVIWYFLRKILCRYFWATFGKIGLLFISTSGHTDQDLNLVVICLQKYKLLNYHCDQMAK